MQRIHNKHCTSHSKLLQVKSEGRQRGTHTHIDLTPAPFPLPPPSPEEPISGRGQKTADLEHSSPVSKGILRYLEKEGDFG